MKKIIIAIVIILACVFSAFGLSRGISTLKEEPSREPVAVKTCVKEENRLNYTYTISSVIELGREGHRVYAIKFEEKTLAKVRATGLTFNANEEFGSTLKVGQKLTVKEIEENLIY